MFDPTLCTTTPSAQATLRQIESRFGFVPPFFSPAVKQPEILWLLWQQTLFAYIDNSLPSLFKEKLAAVLGRYCSARYCLICHTCSLRPLGMQPSEVLALMQRATPIGEELAACIEHTQRELEPGSSTLWTATFESAVIWLSVTVFRGGPAAIQARTVLARVLDVSEYDHLIAFLSYNRMCHEWIEAHPEISYELDRRFLEHYEPLVKDAAALADLLTGDENDELPLIDHSGAGLIPEADAIMQHLSAEQLQSVLHAFKEGTATLAQEVLAIVSHDLRNPLTAISNVAQLLSRNKDAKVQRLAANLKRSTERATRLIADLLDFSQARMGGGIPIQRAPLDLRELLRDTVNTMSQSDPNRLIALRVDGDLTGQWDRERLQQALINLLANALAHSPADSTVYMTGADTGRDIRIRITNDNLSGAIPPEIHRHLFEPFKRFSIDSANPRHSVGLGLYIVDQIVRGHDGQILVESAERQTHFTLVLPRAARERHQADA